MSTDKQKEANKKNALLSTGPITEEGKAIVALNAVKYGIFSKQLIVDSGIGKENEIEYYEILNNLIECLLPNNQMESLLVEKIAIDFWRLRRVLRFETGSIKKYLDEILKDFYSSYSNKTTQQIDSQIENKKDMIDWNYKYIDCLKKGLVTFDKSVWKGQDIENDVIEDFYTIAKNIEYDKKTKEENEKLYNYKYNFIEMKVLIKKFGYSSDTEISSKLIEIYLNQNEKTKEEIQELEQEKVKNFAADELNAKICAIPQDDCVDKIMKYENSLQRSIYQNLLLLKKLQEV